MAMIQRLLARVVVIASFALSVGSVSAQNVMHLRIDTVTADPGATVNVRVLYTFTSTHAHDIHDFLARFLFDTVQSRVDTLGDVSPFIMNGAAPSPEFNVTWSLTGLLALGGSEIDLSDSVLFTIRMILDSNADTAWIRWDPKWTLSVMQTFQYGDEGVDSLFHEDGWIRTPQSKAIVQAASSVSKLPQIYPNPAYNQVTIDAPGYTESATLEVFDVTGKLCFDGHLVHGAWQVPPEFKAGAYEVVLSDKNQKPQYIGTLIVAPR
jgi:hypothetical protein